MFSPFMAIIREGSENCRKPESRELNQTVDLMVHFFFVWVAKNLGSLYSPVNLGSLMQIVREGKGPRPRRTGTRPWLFVFRESWLSHTCSRF